MANTSKLALTRDNIIEAAMRRAGALGTGESAAATAITDYAQTLNVIIKQFDSATWFKYLIQSTEQTFNTAGGTASYDLGAEDLWVEQMNVEIATDIDAPLKIITVGEYNQIRDKARPGIPTHVYITDDLDTPGASIPDQKAYFWPVPNATIAITFVSRRKVKVFGASGDFLDLPDQWTRAIIFQLAADIAFEINASLEKIQLLQQLADRAMKFAMADQIKQIDGQDVLADSAEVNSVDEPVTTKRIAPDQQA